MQSVSIPFATRTEAAMRPITWRVLMSFEKTYDAGIDFFTIGTSTIGGTDLLKGDSTVVQDWDKYAYDDYSDRILSVEINRESEPPANPVTLATATVVFDNHDDIFTPGNTNSPLDGFLLPRRPIRINLGFGGETIPKFVGLTTGKPDIDDKAKTATFQCIDFLNALMNQPLDSEVMYQDMRSDEIISALLQSVAGLSTSQFDLDYGQAFIPFAFFANGSKLGDALHDIAEAELGNIRMREDGVIVFENRTNWNSNVSVFTFNKNNVLERNTRANSTVINVVEIYSQARQVQALQSLWQNDGPVTFSDNTNFIAPGETKFIFCDFKDAFGALPVTSVDDPARITVATTSLYAGNTAQDSTGTDTTANISLESSDLFSTTIKLAFKNNGSANTYLTQLELFATPAKVVNDIYVRVQDDASVGTKDGYEEQPLNPPITNNLIQDATAANTLGVMILEDCSTDLSQEQWLAKSVPHLQVGDLVTYQDENTDEEYFVTRVNDIVNNSGYRQILQVSKRTINVYFRIGISTIGGADKLGP